MPAKSPVRLLGTMVVCLAVAVAACGDDGGNATGGAPVSPEANTSGAVATTPSTAGQSPTGPCDAPPVPSGVQPLGNLEADVNNDLAQDTVTLYPGGDPTPYRLRIELGNSMGATETIVTGPEGGDPGEAPSLIGAADISYSEGNGEELALVISRGAANDFVGFYKLTGCDLVPIRRQGEANIAVFAVGGSVMALSGLRCERGEGSPFVVEVKGTSTDGTSYATTRQNWQVTNGEFVKIGPPVTVPGSAPPAAELDCFGLVH